MYLRRLGAFRGGGWRAAMAVSAGGGWRVPMAVSAGGAAAATAGAVLRCRVCTAPLNITLMFVVFILKRKKTKHLEYVSAIYSFFLSDLCNVDIV